MDQDVQQRRHDLVFRLIRVGVILVQQDVAPNPPGGPRVSKWELNGEVIEVPAISPSTMREQVMTMLGEAEVTLEMATQGSES